MTEEEIINQQFALRDSIIRLCNEADTNGIALGAIIMAYTKWAEHMKMTPNRACEVLISAIDIMTRKEV